MSDVSCRGVLVFGLFVILAGLPATSGAGSLPPPVSDADFPAPAESMVRLGKLLFFDKILSGNGNTSCATCHHPMAFTGDGLSLPIGEGGAGLGVTRDTGSGSNSVHERVPRHSPHLFNVGAFEFTRMFHDGRVELMPSHPTGFRSPAGDHLPPGLASPLAVQAMFPVTSATEMAGQAGENPVADAVAAGDLFLVWELLAERLRSIPEYVDRFIEAFEDIDSAGDITFVHVANAIASFEAAGFRATDSPFDRWLRGDTGAMSLEAIAGMKLFYGRAGCADCHSGRFQTDHEFWALGVPQIGPGKGDDLDDGQTGGRHDYGRERVTGDRDDRMRFRTPSLRNVALTAPYGHDGAYSDLEKIVRHHYRPGEHLRSYRPGRLALPRRPDLDDVDMVVMNDPVSVDAIEATIEIPRQRLRAGDVTLILEFLHALTDRGSLDLRRTVPKQVPSGISMYD